MSNDLVPWSDQERMATAIAKSGLFGLKDTTQVLALMAVAQAEGRHPASVAKDYHIIQGRPALKADAILGYSLSKIAWEGPEAELTQTCHCQPALYVHGLACLAALRSQVVEVHELVDELPADVAAYAFWSMLAFLGVLTVGFIYEWKKGALDWE